MGYISIGLRRNTWLVEELVAVPADKTVVVGRNLVFPLDEVEVVWRVLAAMCRVAAARGAVYYLSRDERVLGERRPSPSGEVLFLDRDLYLDLASFFTLLRVAVRREEYRSLLSLSDGNTRRKYVPARRVTVNAEW